MGKNAKLQCLDVEVHVCISGPYPQLPILKGLHALVNVVQQLHGFPILHMSLERLTLLALLTVHSEAVCRAAVIVRDSEHNHCTVCKAQTLLEDSES